MARREKRGGAVEVAGLVQVRGGYSQAVSAGSIVVDGKRKRLQFRLKIAIDESVGSPEQQRARARDRLIDILAMRDALVAVGRCEQAAYLCGQAGLVADDEEKFQFALAAANVVMSRPQQQSEASTKFVTWGQLARAWANQELARLYPNAGYGKKTGEDTDGPRVEYFCKYIGNVPLATFSDDDYWRAMRPARERCRTDSTFRAFSQVLRRVLKIAVELRIIAAWPLGATCKLPRPEKGTSPVFPFLYPDEYVRLMRCELIPIQFRVLYGFIIREGLRISEAIRIRWEHLTELPNGRWLLEVPDTKTGRALNFVLNPGTGEVLHAFRRVLVPPEAPPLRTVGSKDRRALANKLARLAVPAGELSGPFAWVKPSNVNNAAKNLRRHVEMSGTTRARLLFNDGRLRRLREHDLRSTFVTWCKLAGVDNETISQHTGHESSTMIARYNRSKATIEHIGLPPYLPLHEAMLIDAAGELVAPPIARFARAVPLLGAGEPTAEAGSQPTTDPATESEPGNQSKAGYGNAFAAEPGGAPATSPRAPFSAPPGEAFAVEGDGSPEGAGRPCCGACGQAMPAGPGQYTGHCPGCGAGWDGSETTAAPGRNGRDAGRDGASRRLRSTRGADENGSRFDAGARGGSRTRTPGWAMEPKSDPGRQEPTKPEDLAPPRAPEAPGTGAASHPPVTLLDQLRAAARQAVDENNWPAVKALEPLIEAERVRLSNEAAARRQAEPVRLEVVRARRDGGAK